MKEKYIRRIILSLVFVLALFVFSAITNKGNADMTADMDSPTLPMISFEAAQKEVNLLAGHKKEMSLSAMRDTITPLNKDDSVTVLVHAFDQTILKLKYIVYSLDGSSILKSGEANIADGKSEFVVGDVLNGTEGILRVELVLENDVSVYYYTRIISSEDLNIAACLDYIESLHEAMIDRSDDDLLRAALESNHQGDNTTLQHVTIHSDLEHAKWDELRPEVVSEVRYSIQETKAAYTSVELNYRVKCVGDNNAEEFHDVDEYFQVCISNGKKYLLNYDRTLQEVFDATNVVLSSKGIILGLTTDDIQYISNQEGTIVAFVQNRALWTYNKAEDEFAYVFSFEDTEKGDIRNQTAAHEIKILSMDTDGSLTFAVYGYMNRGVHEGESGFAIYYFNLPQNVIEEVAFVSSNQSELMIEKIGELAYYNHELNCLYVMLSGTLQKIDLETNETTILLDHLQSGQYVSSEDGQMLAYQTDETASEVVVMNFAENKEQRVLADDGAKIIPLGFVLGDFVYGMAKEENIGKTASGESVQGMHYLEIRDENNTVVKTYEIPGTYIIDVSMNGNMITLERALKNQDNYNVIAEDYITNNVESASTIELKSYWTDLKQTQYRLVFEDGIENKKARLLMPKHVLFERNTTIANDVEIDMNRYAVYGYGDLLGLYAEAGTAIQHAKEVSGVVISPKQHYVWEDGNRVAWYRNFNVPKFVKQSGETSLEACVRAIMEYVGQEIDVKAAMANKSVEQILSDYCGGEGIRLKGCSSSDVRYLIDKAVPVIAMTGNQEAVLLVGYDAVSVTYMEPHSGAVRMKNFSEMDSMMKSTGSTFFAYTR